MKKTNYIVGLIAIILLSACSGADRRNITRTDTLTSGIADIAADECLAPIIDEEIMVFEALNREAAIIPTYTSDYQLYDMLVKDSIRLIIGTRELTNNEIAIIKERKQRVRSQKIAMDGIALITNKANTDTLLSIKDLRNIITGETRTWKDVNPNSKLGNIAVAFDSPNSSTVRYIKDSICGDKPIGDNVRAISPDSKSIDITDATPNQKVIEYVASNPNALGIIGVNWISNPGDTTNLSFIDKINVVSVSREDKATPANSFKPYPYQLAMELAYRMSSESDQKGGYPLTRDVYIIITDVSGGLTAGFVNFVAGDRGQRIILKAGLLPANRPVRLVRISPTM